MNRLIPVIENEKYLGNEGDARGKKRKVVLTTQGWEESWKHHNAFRLRATASLFCHLIVALGIICSVFQIEGTFNSTLYHGLCDLSIKQLRETWSTFYILLLPGNKKYSTTSWFLKELLVCRISIST